MNDELNPNWTSIDLYYKGFHIKKSVPKELSPEDLIKGIESYIAAGFEPSWNKDTTERQLDPIMNATKDAKIYTCKECGAKAEYKTGVSTKTGKPWKALFCTENKEHVEWLH